MVAFHAKGIDMEAGKNEIEDGLAAPEALKILFWFDLSVLEVLSD